MAMSMATSAKLADLLPECDGWIDDIAMVSGKCLSLVLYLCSESPDYDRKPPENPKPTRTRRRGLKTFPASSPTTIRIGAKIGATIRSNARATAQSGVGQTKRPVMPHIRRAHWHTYWTGSDTNKRPVLRWLHPIMVGAANIDAIPTTIRPITGHRRKT